MEKLVSVESKIIPLNIRDIDTDMIIPANFLTSVDRQGYGENVFRRLRDNDPNFPVNLPQFQGSQIIVADDNFGCGSSREHAVWALQGWGIKAVISKSFADIFAGNSAKNGLLTIVLPEKSVDQLLELGKSGDCFVKVDLSQQLVFLPDGSTQKFEFDPFRRHCIMNGLDDFDYLLSHLSDIKKFKSSQVRFFSSNKSNN
jgi:3-isopropylmalate/(R)-2-methylmalate dehydratase small subunit